MSLTGMRRILLMLLFLIPFTSFSQVSILDNIANAIKSGNSKEISKYFDNNVEITIVDKESVYSKVQAEMVLRDFFAKNPVQSFEIIHRGKAEGSAYAIGPLKSTNQSFRVYFYIKNKGSAQQIQEMRFEKKR
ncbi:MAG: DUF4783 domain-containing protein [Chitinophagales bacterium]|nr:DUF4783 domain-containing protein [Chitinophagales bacterium]